MQRSLRFLSIAVLLSGDPAGHSTLGLRTPAAAADLGQLQAKSRSETIRVEEHRRVPKVRGGPGSSRTAQNRAANSSIGAGWPVCLLDGPLAAQMS